jgi:hypothetical protein
MDNRQTLSSGETFLELLKTSYQDGKKVALLVDDEGITRMEGCIKALNTSGSTAIVELEGAREIGLDKIVAVNGVFRPEYGEC